MLYTPSTNKRSKRGLFGVVTSSGTSGPFMRRLSFPVQSGTKPSTMWRQIFLATKQNWAALGVNGAGNIPVNGVDPQSAWAFQAASYFGIMQAGLIVNGVQTMGRLVGCATPDAYYTMVQANRASLGLAPLPAPELVNQYLALASGTNNQAIDGWAVSLSGPSTVDPETPSIQVAVTFDQTPLPAAPTNFQASATGLACVTTQPSLFFDYYLGETTNVTAAVANGSSITYTVVANPYGNGIVGSLFACAGFTPTGFNCSLALITAASGDNITVASNTPAGSALTLGTATFYPVIANWYTASINVSPTSATTSGAITLNFSFQDANGTQNGSITVNASTGNTQVAQPCPTFNFPNSMSCSTLYDSGYNVLGFSLSYSAVDMTSFPMTRNGVEVPGLWALTASDQYTDSYSPPDASQWSPILFSGPYLPTPAEVLAAWETVWGDLADSGNIKFQLSYLDPNTGASGPALSVTAGWAKGTLKGFDRSLWTGPLFGWYLVPGDTTIAAPGTATATISVYGLSGYGGTITFTPKSNSVLSTGYNSTKKAFGAGFTITVSPASVTIPTGSSTPVSATVTMTAASWSQQFAGPISISATDGLTTTSAAFQLTVSGDVVPQPPPNYLSISPGVATPTVNNPGTTTVALTLTNTGPDDLQPSMLATCSDSTVGLSFDVTTPDVQPATIVILDTPPITVAGYDALMNGSGSQFSPAIPYTGDFTGWYIQTTGWAPASLNQGPEPVTTSSGGIFQTATIGAQTSPTAVGSIILTNPNNVSNTPAPSFTQTTPSTALVNLSIVIPAAIDTSGLGIQVEAGAGTNTAQSIVSLS